MTELGEGEYGGNQAVEMAFKSILTKADKFRTQVAENATKPAERKSSEPGHRMANELFLDGVIAAQTLGKDQMRDLLKEIEYREIDHNWAQGYREKLGLTPQAVAEWQHQQAGKARIKGLVSKLNPFRGDKGMDSQGREL